MLFEKFSGAEKLPYFFLVTILLIISITLIWRISKCQIGNINAALNQSDKLAASVGINIVKYRLISICISCFLGGICGAFFAAYTTTVLPQTYQLWTSIYLIIYCLLGGVHYFFGSILGAFFFQAVFPFLRALHQYQALIYASIMIVIILWLPNGILSVRICRKKVVIAKK
jgi:branched-chain amino acid transport system permease protein